MAGLHRLVASFGVGAAVGSSALLALMTDNSGSIWSRGTEDRISTKAIPATEGIPDPKQASAAASVSWKESSNLRHRETSGGSPFLEPVATSQRWDPDWDRRHHRYQHHLRHSLPTRHLILVRHGQYHVGAKSEADRTLTELGFEQADRTGARLASFNLPLTNMVSSTMIRALQTADQIAKHLPETTVVLKPDPLLCEGAPFPPEPRAGSFRPELHYHVDSSRIEAAFRKYFHRADPDQSGDSFELVVCHANVIRYFVCRALQLPPEAWLRISLKHASLTWITIRPDGRASVRTLGDAGHLPPDKLTTTLTVTPF